MGKKKGTFPYIIALTSCDQRIITFLSSNVISVALGIILNVRFNEKSWTSTSKVTTITERCAHNFVLTIIGTPSIFSRTMTFYRASVIFSGNKTILRRDLSDTPFPQRRTNEVTARSVGTRAVHT